MKRIKRWTSIVALIALLCVSFTGLAFAIGGHSQVYESTSSVISLPSESVKGQVNVTAKGNTYTNLLGNDGDCEDVSMWTEFQGSATLDSTRKVFGTNSIKITKTTLDGHLGLYQDVTNKIDTSKCYFVSAYLKNDNLTNGLYPVMVVTGGTNVKGTTITGNSFTISGFKISPTQLSGATSILLEAYSQLASVDQYGYIDGFMLTEITQTEYDTLTIDELLAKYPYVEGTKSVLTHRLKSVGKNLFDGELVRDETYNGITGEPTAFLGYSRNKNKCLKVPSDTASIVISNDNSSIRSLVYWYDENKNYLSFTDVTNQNAQHTKPTKAVYYNFSINTVDDNTTIWSNKNVAISYEEYKESIQYITLPEGEELRSLPNGTKDEVTVDGKYIQRTKKYVLQSENMFGLTSATNIDYISLNYNNIEDIYAKDIGDGFGLGAMTNRTSPRNGEPFDSVDSEWAHYFNTTNWVIVVPRGTYSSLAEAQADLAGTTLIYQLAQPKTYTLNTTPLIGFENGTLFIEKAVNDTGIYESKITVSDLRLPIEMLEEVNKMENGALIPVDLSNVTIASDRLSLTINGATQGDMYQIVYYYPEELSTNPTITYSVPIDSTGQIDGNTDMIQQQSDLINYILQQIELLRGEMQDLNNLLNQN